MRSYEKMYMPEGLNRFSDRVERSSWQHPSRSKAGTWESSNPPRGPGRPTQDPGHRSGLKPPTTAQMSTPTDRRLAHLASHLPAAPRGPGFSLLPTTSSGAAGSSPQLEGMGMWFDIMVRAPGSGRSQRSFFEVQSRKRNPLRGHDLVPVCFGPKSLVPVWIWSESLNIWSEIRKRAVVT